MNKIDKIGLFPLPIQWINTHIINWQRSQDEVLNNYIGYHDNKLIVYFQHKCTLTSIKLNLWVYYDDRYIAHNMAWGESNI